MKVERHQVLHVRFDGLQFRAILNSLSHRRDGRLEIGLLPVVSQKNTFSIMFRLNACHDKDYVYAALSNMRHNKVHQRALA
jgi:hypothetical protein